MNKNKLDATWISNKVSRRQALKELCGSGLAVFVPVLGSYGCASDDTGNGSGSSGVGGQSPSVGGSSGDASTSSSATGGQNSSTLNRGGASAVESSASGGVQSTWSSSSAADGGSTLHSSNAQGGTSANGAYGGTSQGGTSQRNSSSATTNASSRGGTSSTTEMSQGGTSLGNQGGSKSGAAGSSPTSARGGNGSGGSSLSTSANAGANSGGARGSVSSSSGVAGASSVPNFEDAAACKLTTTDIEGPFFIDDNEFPDDESLIRSDVREGLAGCEFRLYFRLLNAKQSCSPIALAELYIWHCNADGYYSGFNGQDPKTPYTGAAERTPDNMERFCRGVQSTDTRGIASFTTIYPGWYAGRPIHVHLMGRIKGQTTRLITTQLYFPANFTMDVHQSEPAYQARASAMPAGSRNPPSGNPAIPTLTHTPGLVTGTLNVIVNG